MASTFRSVDTRFWSDVWVRHLNALDRYMFLYFLTNEHSTWCGVYELDITMMAFESGIDMHDLEKSILPKLSPKIVYVDGWVYIKNFERYHSNDSKDTKEGIKKAWMKVPEKIRLKIRELTNDEPLPIGGGVGVSSLASASASALKKERESSRKLDDDLLSSKFLITTKPEETEVDDVEVVFTDDDGNPLPPRKPKTDRTAIKTFNMIDESSKLKSSSYKPNRVLNAYWTFKGLEFDNYFQWKQQYNRDIKAAKMYAEADYSSSFMRSSMAYCEENYSDVGWSIETLLKKSAEFKKKGFS